MSASARSSRTQPSWIVSLSIAAATAVTLPACTTNNYYGSSGNSSSEKTPASGDAGTRSLKGTLSKGSPKTDATHVAAIELTKKGAKSRTVRATVASDGSFSVDLPTGSRWMLVAQSDHSVLSVLHFPASKSGRATAAFAWSGDDASDPIDLGSIAFHSGALEAELNLFTILDFDHDGTSDFDDDDDDDDGTLDDDDEDDDNDGIDDDEEDGDSDDDGDIDLIDDDDDDDGINDAQDDDDDGDGVLDANEESDAGNEDTL